MKKILLSVCAMMLITSSAHADKRIGISAAFTMFDTSGTETTKSSSEKNSTTKEEEVVVPSLFFEIANDRGAALGFDIVPVDNQELGSGTGSDDDAETSGANKASAELTGHYTVYGLAPIGSAGGYLKAGLAYATIDTTETLATGTKYGNEDVKGFVIGVGVNKERDNGAFFRVEGTYTDYEDVSFLGTFNGNATGDSAVRNKIDADIDAVALRISLGKSF